jgi:iron(III) transport system permease protein
LRQQTGEHDAEDHVSPGGPAFLSAFVLNFLRGLRSFETPVLQGTPANIKVFVSRVYDSMALEFNTGLATAYSVVLVALSVITLYFMCARPGFPTATRRLPERLSRQGYRHWAVEIPDVLHGISSTSWSASRYLSVVLIVVSMIPYFDYDTFMKFPTNAVLTNYYTVMRHPSFVTGFYNSLVLSVTIAFVTVLAGIVMAFTIYRTRASGARVFEFIGTLPLAFPPLVLSLALVIIFLGTPLYNSLWALGIGLFVAYFSVRFS